MHGQVIAFTAAAVVAVQQQRHDAEQLLPRGALALINVKRSWIG
jgi:hypothetical protein